MAHDLDVAFKGEERPQSEADRSAVVEGRVRRTVLGLPFYTDLHAKNYKEHDTKAMVDAQTAKIKVEKDLIETHPEETQYETFNWWSDGKFLPIDLKQYGLQNPTDLADSLTKSPSGVVTIMPEYETNEALVTGLEAPQANENPNGEKGDLLDGTPVGGRSPIQPTPQKDLTLQSNLSGIKAQISAAIEVLDKDMETEVTQLSAGTQEVEKETGNRQIGTDAAPLPAMPAMSVPASLFRQQVDKAAEVTLPDSDTDEEF